MRPITIIGGGLAGLSLGIILRAEGIPVEIFEAGSYPRHRVCGEFISGRGVALLERLGASGPLRTAGARTARTLAFFSPNRCLARLVLPHPALCVSRFVLDKILADRFQESGGQLHCQSRRTVDAAEGFVFATGRKRESSKQSKSWFGLKAHAAEVALSADLEMHLSSRGYVGLCRSPETKVNVCGILQRSPPSSRPSQTAWHNHFCADPHSLLRTRLAPAQWDESSFCSVAGISFSPFGGRSSRPHLALGDHWSMIAPITGNGMSVALESAALAAPFLQSYSRGQRSWESALQETSNALDRALRWRYFAGYLAQSISISRLGRVLFMPLLQSNLIRSAAFQLTR